MFVGRGGGRGGRGGRGLGVRGGGVRGGRFGGGGRYDTFFLVLTMMFVSHPQYFHQVL